MNYKTTFLVVIALSLSLSQAIAGEKPPSNSMTLSEIAKSLESKGYSPITDISFEDGVWEVEAYKAGEERELKVDPANADIISDRPDD